MNKTIVVLLLSLVLMACDRLSKKASFHIDTPVGWTREDTIQEGGDSLVKLKSDVNLPGADIKETISLLVETNFNRNDREHNLLRHELKRDADFYEETGNGHRVIDGIESNWFEVGVKYKTSNFPCTQRYYFTTGNKYRYMFILTCPPKGFDHLRPVADSLFNSFKILDE